MATAYAYLVLMPATFCIQTSAFLSKNHIFMAKQAKMTFFVQAISCEQDYTVFQKR